MNSSASARFERSPPHARTRGCGGGLLKGQVAAARFVEGVAQQVRVAAASLRRTPAPEAGQETQLLFGEVFVVYDERDGWAWGQSRLDSYVGYILSSELAAPVRAADHRVIAPRTLAFSQPNLKSRPGMVLPLNAKLAIDTEDGKYSHAAGAGWIYTPHSTEGSAVERMGE